MLDREYPNIGIPAKSARRSDIFYQDIETIRINDIYFWRINIWFNFGNVTNPSYVRIVCINIITSLEIYDDENNFEYNPNILFNYYIEKLKNENTWLRVGHRKKHPSRHLRTTKNQRLHSLRPRAEKTIYDSYP